MSELLLLAGLKPEDLPAESCGTGQAHADALYLLTRLTVSPEEAVGFWREILLHHKSLCQTLGRDVGLRVAVCDYFTNMHPRMHDPIIVEVQVLLQKERGALVDELTGLYNRRYFNEALGREVERFKRFGQRFSLVMLDVDHFKVFNDTHGHLAGDEALKAVSQALRDTARSFDHVVRYGGEEFALVLPHTDADQALAAAERLRAVVAARPVSLTDNVASLTVSLGVATFPEDALNVRDLQKRADEALYEAKRTRNCACSASERKRRHPRAPLNTPVQLTCLDGKAMNATALNISFGGLLCLSQTPLQPGTRSEISLEPHEPGAKGLRLLARVARVQREAGDGDYNVGLAFDPGSQEQRRTLLRLVEMNQDRLHSVSRARGQESPWPAAGSAVSVVSRAG